MKLEHKITKILASTWFFRLTIAIFAAEVSWLVFTSRFPMAFDEAFHLGMIQFFVHHFNPVITSQPASSYKYGAIIQDPSFLYHYLMSFPYRLMSMITASLEVKVIILRFINLFFALSSLIIMKKLLRRISLSELFSNLTILLFALTPIFTVLSAQISYDNLFILMTALCLYETVIFLQQLDRKQFSTKQLMIVLSLCLFSSLVKYAFLPILLGVTITVIWKIVDYQHRSKFNLITVALADLRKLSVFTKSVLIITCLLGGSLFVRFYGVNIVKYRNPAPQCNQLLSIQACEKYYAWDENYTSQQNYKSHRSVKQENVIAYGFFWLYAYSLYLYGSIMPLQGFYYIPSVFYLMIALALFIGLVFTIINFGKIYRQHIYVVILSFISLVYVMFLFGKNYFDYLQLGHPAAISGRYLLPVIFYFYILLGLGIKHAFEEKKWSIRAKKGMAVIIVLAFVCYGGFSQYVLYITPKYGHLKPNNNFTLKWP